jgi:hypothetical protein
VVNSILKVSGSELSDTSTSFENTFLENGEKLSD